MTKDNIATLENKRCDICSVCQKIIFYNTAAIDRQGNLIPLDINKKRHHCNGAQQIAYEEKIVKEIQHDKEL